MARNFCDHAYDLDGKCIKCGFWPNQKPMPEPRDQELSQLNSEKLRCDTELVGLRERVAELERQLFAAQSDILREGMERDQAQAECARLKNIEAIAVRATEWACECQGEAMRYRQALEYCACEGQDDADIHAMDQFKLAEILIGIRNCAQSALSGEEERKG